MRGSGGSCVFYPGMTWLYHAAQALQLLIAVVRRRGSGTQSWLACRYSREYTRAGCIVLEIP